MQRTQQHQEFLDLVLRSLQEQADPSAWKSTSDFSSEWQNLPRSSIRLIKLLQSDINLETKVEASQMFVRQRAPQTVDRLDTAQPRGISCSSLAGPTSEPVVYVNTEKSCQQALRVLNESVQSAQFLAVGLERCSETGRIWLVQVATATNVFIFDLSVPHSSVQALVATLSSLLGSKDTSKIMHDCREDLRALDMQFKIEVANVVDTQVLHEYIQHHRLPAVVSSPTEQRISFNELLATYDVSGDTEPMFKNEISARAGRPLSPVFLDVQRLCTCHEAMKAVAKQIFNSNLRNLTAVHCRSNPQPDQRREPMRICFDADGNAIYSSELPLAPVAEESIATTGIDIRDAEVIALLAAMPDDLRCAIVEVLERATNRLVEIIVDHGRAPSLLFADGSIEDIAVEPAKLSTLVTSCLESLIKSSDSTPPGFFAGVTRSRKLFTDDNRMGLPGTLHRISGIQDRQDNYVGFTFRIGRYIAGASELLYDLAVGAARKNKGILLVGCPGSGKTTVLRDLIGRLSGLHKRVVFVDTSNEISGDGDVPHGCVGRARRMQVKYREKQHEVLVEAVQNHNPEIIVIDEIGTQQEVKAAKTISQRGVTLIGTAHGSELRSVLKNPDLNGLVGGKQSVTLGDLEMRKRGKGKKTIFERAGIPVFGAAVEVLEKQRFRIFKNVAETIDAILGDKPYLVEERWREGPDMFSRQFYENLKTNHDREHWFRELLTKTTHEARFQQFARPICSSSN